MISLGSGVMGLLVSMGTTVVVGVGVALGCCACEISVRRIARGKPKKSSSAFIGLHSTYTAAEPKLRLQAFLLSRLQLQSRPDCLQNIGTRQHSHQPLVGHHRQLI